MNYADLFPPARPCVGDIFQYSLFRQQKDIRNHLYDKTMDSSKPGKGLFRMLFTLNGSLEMHFPSRRTDLPEGHLTVVNVAKLSGCFCQAGTVLLSYSPPERLSAYFDQCEAAFHMPCPSIVKIRPALQTWTEDLLRTLADGREFSVDFYHECRKKLASLLKEYPREMLGELYIPFFACSRISCEECKSTDEPVLP